jgi:hypothetical protein
MTPSPDITPEATAERIICAEGLAFALAAFVPDKGGLPEARKLLKNAITAAIKAEREAAAVLADEMVRHWREEAESFSYDVDTQMRCDARANCAEQLAAAIRGRL